MLVDIESLKIQAEKEFGVTISNPIWSSEELPSQNAPEITAGSLDHSGVSNKADDENRIIIAVTGANG